MTTKTAPKRSVILFFLPAAMLLVLTVLLLLHARNAAPQAASAPTDATEPAATQAPTLPPPDPNPYGPADFQYVDGYLTCLAGESVLGIDVSELQGEIDWAQVKDAGIEFVMIRIGFRGYGEEGNLCADELAQANYQGAREAGLKIGAYFFSQALNTAEAMEEARFALAQVADWTLDMPLVFDWEYLGDYARTAWMDSRTLTYITMAFCNAVRDAGFTPAVYFNHHQSTDLLYLEELTDYPFWLAMYSDRMTFPYKLAMWQYSCTGSVPGIVGDVDLNLYFPEVS